VVNGWQTWRLRTRDGFFTHTCSQVRVITENGLLIAITDKNELINFGDSVEPVSTQKRNVRYANN
jgi:hypothetical protein